VLNPDEPKVAELFSPAVDLAQPAL